MLPGEWFIKAKNSTHLGAEQCQRARAERATGRATEWETERASERTTYPGRMSVGAVCNICGRNISISWQHVASNKLLNCVSRHSVNKTKLKQRAEWHSFPMCASVCEWYWVCAPNWALAMAYEIWGGQSSGMGSMWHASKWLALALAFYLPCQSVKIQMNIMRKMISASSTFRAMSISQMCVCVYVCVVFNCNPLGCFGFQCFISMQYYNSRAKHSFLYFIALSPWP